MAPSADNHAHTSIQSCPCDFPYLLHHLSNAQDEQQEKDASIMILLQLFECIYAFHCLPLTIEYPSCPETPDKPLALHVYSLLHTYPIVMEYIHTTCFQGHTLLTWSIQLGRKACVYMLLELHVSVLMPTPPAPIQPSDQSATPPLSWSPFQEAISYGDRDMMEWLYKARRRELAEWFETKGQALLLALSENVHDFTMTLKWSLQSWIPFVSQLCPSDAYKVYKKGNCLRIDSTLVGFEDLTWIRGHLSLVFSTRPTPRLVLIDHDRRVYQQVYPQDMTLTPQDMEQELNVCFNSPNVSTPLVDTTALTVEPLVQRSLFTTLSTLKREQVGEFDNVQVYELNGLNITWYARHEHLQEEKETQWVIMNPDKEEEEEKEKEKNCSMEEQDVLNRLDDYLSQKDNNLSQESLLKKKSSRWSLLTQTVAQVDKMCENETFESDQQEQDWSNQVRGLFDQLNAYRPSLSPPDAPGIPSTLLFQEYHQLKACLNMDSLHLDLRRFLNLQKTPDQARHFGRERQVESTSRQFNARLWMYEGSVPIVQWLGQEKEKYTRELEERRRILLLEKEKKQASSFGWLDPSRYLPTSVLSMASSYLPLQSELEALDQAIAECHYEPPVYPLSNYIPAIQSPQFPLSIHLFLPLLELLSGSLNSSSLSALYVQSLQDFFHVQLPRGFPVQVEIPLGKLPVSLLLQVTSVQVVPKDTLYHTCSHPPCAASQESACIDYDAWLPDDLFFIPGKKQGYRPGEVILTQEPLPAGYPDPL